MSVNILSLTNTDQVRSAIGIDETDVEDVMIVKGSPDEDLQVDLLSWLPDYSDVISDGSLAAPSDAQKLKYLQLKLYSKYFVAAIVCLSCSNSILQKNSDGSNEASRFTNVKITDLAEALRKKALELKGQIQAIEAASSEDTSFSVMGSAAPSVDEVTLQ